MAGKLRFSRLFCSDRRELSKRFSVGDTKQPLACTHFFVIDDVIYKGNKYMPSKQCIAIEKILRTARDLRLRSFDPTSALRAKRRQNAKRYIPPRAVRLIMRPECRRIASTTCYTIGKGSKCVLYFHGGSYVDPPLIFHWRFLQVLTRRAGCSAVLPLYGRAPQHKCERTVLHMARVYKDVCKRFGVENVIIMGDSAGGGLALALTEYLAKKGAELPQKVVLLSPWLDVDMTGEYPNEDSDPTLSKVELTTFGAAYRRDLPVGNYLASPLFGVTDKLPPLYVYVGENEMFLYDCIKLKRNCDSVGVFCQLKTYPDMPHVFVEYPMPDANEAKDEIVRLVSEGE